MGADQQFCLRWNNFHTNITSAFESLRDDEDFVDITLACEGKQIKAHKMVLSACSPYFRSLLKGNPCQHPIVFLKDVTFANLTSILDFMYHGEVNVSHNELATFLKTAESLKVRGLAEDEKKKEAEGYNEASSPPPPRDPPDPGSPRGPGEEANSAPDTHSIDSPPPPKRQRRRSGASIHSAEDTNETVLSEPRDNSVKNEPQDYNEDDADILIHSDNTQDIKQDIEDNSEERNFGLSESVTISRSQAAMQQLQESFGSFLPGMGQSPGFLPHGATDMPRPPHYSLEGVQGLPPGISALPGPSMSQGAASQDASQGSSSMPLEILESIKGGDLLHYQGYLYTIVKAYNNTIYWKCSEKTQGCRGTLVTSINKDNPQPTVQHNHPQETGKVLKARFYYKVRHQARDTDDSAAKIYEDNILMFPPMLKALLPTRKTVLKLISRLRQNIPDPTNFLEVSFPGGSPNVLHHAHFLADSSELPSASVNLHESSLPKEHPQPNISSLPPHSAPLNVIEHNVKPNVHQPQSNPNVVSNRPVSILPPHSVPSIVIEEHIKSNFPQAWSNRSRFDSNSQNTAGADDGSSMSEIKSEVVKTEYFS